MSATQPADDGFDLHPRGVGDVFAGGFMMQDLFALPEPLSVFPQPPPTSENPPPDVAVDDPPPWLLSMPPQPAVFTPRPILSPTPQPSITPWGSRKRANDLLDEDTPGMPSPFGMRTPQRMEKVSEDRASKGSRTPQHAQTPKKNRSPGFVNVETPDSRFHNNLRSPGFVNVETPEAKKSMTLSPPSGPAALQKRLEDDIDAALEWRSMPLLQLALRRGHCCGQDHLVFEAVRRQNMRALHFLLESGEQDVDQRCCGKRPLHLAMQSCIVREDTGYRMAEIILQHGANPDARSQDHSGLTSPLQEVTRRACIAGMELLLKFHADPNKGDKAGLTPMHIFAQQTVFSPLTPYKKVLSCLLACGACPFVADASGNDPLDCAHDESIRKELIRAQRWWSRCSISQVCRLADTQDSAVKNVVPWVLPEISEAVFRFLHA